VKFTFTKALLFLCFLVFPLGCSKDIEAPINTSDTINVGFDSDWNDSVVIGDTTVYEPPVDTTTPNTSEMLVDGSIEVWVNMSGDPHPVNWSCNEVEQTAVNVYHGSYAAQLQSSQTGTTANIRQVINTGPSCRIRIRFKYMFSEYKSNGARTYCYLRTGPAESTTISSADMKAFFSTNEYYILRGGGYGQKYLPHTPIGEWLTFDETITLMPTSNYFVFRINSYYGTTMYVDSCSVTRIL